MHAASWPMWAAVLFLQNISFTYVSRARSSGSLLRHLKASIFSNGIWIFSNMLMLGPLFDYLTGKHGVPMQALAGLIYTVSCVSGSIFAHHLAMKTEKGKNAVGYSSKYAQIPVEEYTRIQRYFALIDIEKFAEQHAQGLRVMTGTPEHVELLNNVDKEWSAVKSSVVEFQKLPTPEEFIRVKSLAENAYTVAIGMIPDSGISAQKFAGEIVTTGLPGKS